MSGLNIKLADLQISDFHAPECCFFCDDILKKTSASGGVAPRPLPGPLDPTGGLIRPPIIFLQSLEFVAETRILAEMIIKNHGKKIFSAEKQIDKLFFFFF